MKLLTAILLLLSIHALGQAPVLKSAATIVDATFRGLSVANGKVAWVSGTKGTIGITTDGGATWQYNHVKGCEQADFRSLYAFDSLNAVAASTGAPAVILRTHDGGRNWDVVYKNQDTAVFFDGIDFWNNRDGIIYGDPVSSRMLLLSTHDGGKSWTVLPQQSRPILEKGEASFAASGTGIRCLEKNKLIIITGGKESRFFISEDRGLTWDFSAAPIIKGQSTTGMFSFAWKNGTAIVVGGDYKRDTIGRDNACILTYNGQSFTWSAMAEPPGGYRECVEFIAKNTLVTAGPSGMDITTDGGMHWHPLTNEKGYHVIRKSRKGNLTIAAGSKGKIARLVWEK